MKSASRGLLATHFTMMAEWLFLAPKYDSLVVTASGTRDRISPLSLKVLYRLVSCDIKHSLFSLASVDLLLILDIFDVQELVD